MNIIIISSELQLIGASQCWQARPPPLYSPYYLPPFTVFRHYDSPKVVKRAYFKFKHSNSISKMKRIRNSYVEDFKKIAQNTRQHCYTKLGKKPKIAIFRCLKNHVKIELEIWNFAGRLDLGQIDCKKSFKFQEHREVGFLEPLFYNRLSWSIYIYIYTYRRFFSKL